MTEPTPQNLSPLGAPHHKLGRVLVVDDEVELVAALREILDGNGFEVSGFTSGEKALAALSRKEFDILLTDLMMPGMDGIEILQAAGKLDPYMAGIVMTGQGSVQTAVNAMKIGAFDYILKPFKAQSILPVLSRALEVRRLRMDNLQLRETMAIYELGQTIAYTLDLNTLLNKTVDAIFQQLDADEVSLMLPSSDGKSLYIAAVRGERREGILGSRVPLDSSIAGWVATHKQPVTLEGEVDDPRFSALFPRKEITTSFSMPMLAGGKLIGVLNANALNLRRFRLGQVKAVSILASTAAAAFESAGLYAKVREAEEKYRTIIENATEGIFQTTPDGQFVTANSALARILGYESPEELLHSVSDVGQQLNLKLRQRMESLGLMPEHGRVHSYEIQLRCKDGGLIWVSVNGRSVRGADGKPVYFEGTVEDISERKRAEEALFWESSLNTKMAELAKALLSIKSFEQICDLILHLGQTLTQSDFGFVGHIDPDTGYLLCPAFSQDIWDQCRVSGKTAGFKKFSGLWGWALDNRKSILTNDAGQDPRSSGVPSGHVPIQRFLASPALIDGELCGLTALANSSRDYIERDLELTERLADLLALAVRRLRNQEALLKSEARYRLLFNNASDALLVFHPVGNGITAKFIEVNDIACGMYGYTRDELLALSPLDINPPEGLDALVERIAKVIRDKHRIFHAVHMTRDGRRLPVETSLHAFELDGKPTILAIVRDISERRRLESQLSQAQKMEAIGTLAGGIAHDFNNILGIMTGYTEMTLLDLPRGSVEAQNLQEALTAGKRAKNLVKQIFAFSRKNEQEVSLLQITPIVKEAVKMLRAALPSTIEIRQEIDVRWEDMVHADPTQIHQIVMNLATNAGHAMRENGGVLGVNLSRVDFEPDDASLPAGLNPGAYIRLAVIDTGHGIEPALIERIFEPYFTTKAMEEGTGLGLSVVHGIVRTLDGAITVESQSAKGSAFNVYLPRVEGEVASKEEDISVSLPRGSESILFIDDEPGLAKTGGNILHRLGYKVLSLTSSVEALEAFRTDPAKFDLVITDQTMPKMTGTKLAAEILRIRPDTPVILCTGCGEPSLSREAEASGIRKFAMKPLRMQDLAVMVRTVLDGTGC